MKTLGICFGATTMQCVVVHSDTELKTVVRTERIAHEGNTREALVRFLSTLDPYEIDRIAVTGRHFRNSVNLSSISEAEAVEVALREEYGPKGVFPDLVISAGGETQLVYKVNTNGGLVSVHSGNKCASGTGEFFVQQVGRMGLDVDEAVEMAQEGSPHKIAGRCSVFCKSDCTHALNKGEPRENIAAGLCQMMADKIGELIKDMKQDMVAIIGGGSLNGSLIQILQKRYKQVITPALAATFEAYGAALWAVKNPCIPLSENPEEFIREKDFSFGTHPALKDHLHLVDFKKADHDTAIDGDSCILGLDVGSTTTKAVLIRESDKKILASVYLRTNGNPVEASRECYRKIKKQIGDIQVTIRGLGVTGSGRQIAGLHALSDQIINEIIAHATAATYFDPDVDTIFEIGGQDAKYTFLSGGVPADYAMNEACSAGTGSFLEEAARESLNVSTELIGSFALNGTKPPNFTDQCAAFISSDIKRAGQEGIARDDILAGLVYSICMNYVNRVKGARAVGRKVFMQGGVCYNKAVPVAMAALMQMPIVVPPDPGLMGAFGVALEVCDRLAIGLAEPARFDLDELLEREAIRQGSFVCAGGKEKCDRKCEIARIRIGEKIYPFGGICDRYYNMRVNKEVNTGELDLVAVRQKLMFDSYGPNASHIHEKRPAKKVGLNSSFLYHSLYPLFSNFFDQLGFEIVVSDEIDPHGLSRIEAAYCLPAELSHGAFQNLLNKDPDFIFLPQVMQLPIPNVPTWSRACVFVQGEPYYLKTTFRKQLEEKTIRLLTPVLKMKQSYDAGLEAMIQLAESLGRDEKQIRLAWDYACDKQRAFEKELYRYGRRAIHHLDKHPEMFGIVLFGRPYNSFADDANMGIPHKTASRGYMIIPHDMLEVEEYTVDKKMFWAMGQKIMKAAQFVKEKNNLFGFYITNFSCGPDSFLLSYFRNLMGDKPSLTLELDQHTADAGIDTRIEAALDIMKSYRMRQQLSTQLDTTYTPAFLTTGKKMEVHTSSGEKLPLNDPRVEVIIPSMGQMVAQVTAAVLRSQGINARQLPIPDHNILLTGRKNTSCKECLPYILTTGGFMDYLQKRTDPDKVTLFLMATGGGPCRLGQYFRSFEQLIHNKQVPNAAMLTISDENSYGGMGTKALLRTWQGIVISDVLQDIRSMLKVTAEDTDRAMEVFDLCWKECVAFFEGSLSVRLSILLSLIAHRLSEIPLKKNPRDVPVISLVGEIYVRRDEFSRKNIVDYLEDRGFMVRIAPLGEYICYSNYVVHTGLGERKFSFKEHLTMRLSARIQEWFERRIKTILSGSGLYRFEMIEVAKTIDGVRHLLDPNFRGECILTVGLGMREILDESCGVISIGPFGCMPSRMAEAILKKEMTVEGKKRVAGWEKRVDTYEDLERFPFLSIETDGNPFPQLVEANLEAFILQAKRVHKRMQKVRGRKEPKQLHSVEEYSLKK
ncbi:MAG: acyl-CoA dehydratase activase [Chitinispirillaceae bacterium]